VTVCIAAVHEIGRFKNPLIILCSDTRLDQGDWGTNESGNKAMPIGYNWAVLMAGSPWSDIQELRYILEANIKAGKCPETKTQIFNIVRESVKEFIASPMHSAPNDAIDLIVAGFISARPVLIYVRVLNGEFSVTAAPGACAIGSGSVVATTMLNLRGYGRTKRLEEALFMVYEAKRASEIVGSVGPGTQMIILGHHPAPEKESMAFAHISGLIMGILDEHIAACGLRPIDGLRDFPQELYG
jgi:hypothetical protein